MKNYNDGIMKKSYDKGDDDDKIIFNITKQKISRLFYGIIQDNIKLYCWAIQEGFRKEINGDIIIDDTLKLVKRF